MQPDAYGELEITIQRGHSGSYDVTLRATDPESRGESAPVRGAAEFDLHELLLAQLDPIDYGRRLTSQLFSSSALRDFYTRTRMVFEHAGRMLRVRLDIDPSAGELNDLRWELLRDASTDAPLATSERTLFSRFMRSQDLRVVQLQPLTQLRAVIAVASPTNINDYALAQIDRDGEVARATRALAGVAITVVGQTEPLTLNRLVDALRMGADIVYLVCHGRSHPRHGPVLFLQDEAGMVQVVKAQEFAQRLGGLRQAPRLMVLASCESAGQASLASLLADMGVLATLAMQEKVTMSTVEQLMPVFFRELLVDGQIDRALAVARGCVQARDDYWVPALYLRVQGGRLWSTPYSPSPPAAVVSASSHVPAVSLAASSAAIHWLHISDFFFKAGDTYDADSALVALLDLVRRERKSRPLDFIVATGDVAHSGRPEEYVPASEFFTELLTAAGLADRRERLVVVPGNHDVDRSAARSLVRTLMSEAESKDYFGPNHPRPHFAKLKAYRAWHDDFFAAAGRTMSSDSTCGPVVELTIRGVSVTILAVNTALFAMGDSADQGGLWIGRRALQGAVKRLRQKPADWTIAAMHHSAEWLATDERAPVSRTLAEAVDVILASHLHASDIVREAGSATTALQLAAGSSSQISYHPCRLFYGTLDGPVLRVRPYTYSDTADRWVLDTAVFPDSDSHQKDFERPVH